MWAIISSLENFFKTDDAPPCDVHYKEALNCLAYPFRLEKRELYDELLNTFDSHIAFPGDESGIAPDRATKRGAWS